MQCLRSKPVVGAAPSRRASVRVRAQQPSEYIDGDQQSGRGREWASWGGVRGRHLAPPGRGTMSVDHGHCTRYMGTRMEILIDRTPIDAGTSLPQIAAAAACAALLSAAPAFAGVVLEQPQLKKVSDTRRGSANPGARGRTRGADAQAVQRSP